jgi:CelD/BcsL family acetyltransferase involved in cellulose biosynthesis
VRPATRSRATPEVAFVEDLESLRDDWERLAASGGNVFGAWEWNELWWRRYGRDRTPRIAVYRDAHDEAVAIVPLFRWSGRGLRFLRLIGHGHGDRLGPVCRDDEPDTAVSALRLALAAEPHDVFVGDWVAGALNWSEALGGRVVRTTGYPILRLPETWPEFLHELSPRFRKGARNRRNRIEREHDVEYRYADASTLEGDLDAAFRLHRARFREHSGCNYCGEHERFQREFAALALERGWLRLLFLEVDGEAVCFEHGFLFGEAYFAYQAGRDPAWDRYSVGTILELETIREAIDGGSREYRFLGGDETYKYRFPAEDPRLETVAVPGSRRGRAAAAALAALWRVSAGETLVRRVGGSKPS